MPEKTLHIAESFGADVGETGKPVLVAFALCGLTVDRTAISNSRPTCRYCQEARERLRQAAEL